MVLTLYEVTSFWSLIKVWYFIKSINTRLYLQVKSGSQFQGIYGYSKTIQFENPYSHVGPQNCSIISTAFLALQTSSRLSCGQSDYSSRCLNIHQQGHWVHSEDRQKISTVVSIQAHSHFIWAQLSWRTTVWKEQVILKTIRWIESKNWPVGLHSDWMEMQWSSFLFT